MRKILGIVSIVIMTVACQKAPSSLGGLQSQSQQNIIGGFQVLPSDPLRKHVVLLRSYTVKEVTDKKPDNFSMCTGIVVSQQHILTAAHCLPEDSKTGRMVMEIHFTTDLTERDEEHVVAYAIKMKEHEEYQMGKRSHFDLAMLKISKPIPEDYEPVTILPASVELVAGDMVVALGFGLKSDSPKIESTSLNKVTGVPVLEDQGTQILLDQTSGKGICSGDSGGPTFFYYQGRPYLLGVNESVVGLTPSSKPTCRSHGLIVKAQTFKPWILKAIKQL